MSDGLVRVTRTNNNRKKKRIGNYLFGSGQRCLKLNSEKLVSYLLFNEIFAFKYTSYKGELLSILIND